MRETTRLYHMQSFFASREHVAWDIPLHGRHVTCKISLQADNDLIPRCPCAIHSALPSLPCEMTLFGHTPSDCNFPTGSSLREDLHLLSAVSPKSLLRHVPAPDGTDRKFLKRDPPRPALRLVTSASTPGFCYQLLHDCGTTTGLKTQSTCSHYHAINAPFFAVR